MSQPEQPQGIASPYAAPKRGLDPAVARVIGLALLVPALIALMLAYAAPTVTSVVDSFYRKQPFRDVQSEFVGLDNYERVFTQGFGSALGITLLITLPLLLTLLVGGPVVAWLAHRSGETGRRLTRVVLVPLLVLFSPVGVAVAWYADRRTDMLRDYPRLGLTWTTWLILFGAVLAVSVTVFLAVLRRRADEPRSVTAALVVGALLGLGGLAYGLQFFDLPYMLARGGRNTATLMNVALQGTFMRVDLGAGAALLTLVGIPLALLGVAAVLIVALSGLRVRWVPDAGRRAPSALATVAVIVLLVGCLAVVAYVLWPWFGQFGQFDEPAGPRGRLDTGPIAINTWVPPLLSAFVGVLLAALAGFGIGALRPLGRFSELLLLPFAPWLFVTPTMQAFDAFNSLGASGNLNTTASLIPPVWINIPALVLFAVLFRGLSEDWRAGRRSIHTALLPALPMAALAVLVTWLVNAQSLMWPMVFANKPELFTGPVALVQLWQSMRVDGLPVNLALPVAAIVGFALAAAALQWFYLDKLSIRAGKDEDLAPADRAATG
ncbi:sugar ABC transporter permease [Luedemannella helvata]|uniref:Sugar ABC transporter permease n=1 Tax=Luedemannella helvata TaxID=349315 RepID=A0ABP4WDN5_9ACTN